MNKELSAYLDLMRVGAATVVFFGHLSAMVITGGFLWQIMPYGHSAVIVFFVLSGFVIQFAAEVKEHTLYDFSVARLARLYSVVLPAILLTAACDAIGLHHNPAVYDLTRYHEIWWRMLGSLFFLTQSWGRVTLLSNDAYWSLPYEFWYYVIFAAATFLKGWKRLVVLAVSGAIAGPAILLLGPIWAAGAMTYRLAKHVTLEKPMAWFVWATSGIAAIAVTLANSDPVKPLSPFLPTAFSWLDLPLGALVAVNIFSASSLSFGLSRFHRPIAKMAGMTFALYLFHFPLMHLASAYVPTSLPVPVRALIVMGAVLPIIYALSFITEGQKRRWRNAIRWLLRPFGAPENKQSAA
jgi:peptidoglycan/LPS O-acetylase OafA/YrhL